MEVQDSGMHPKRYPGLITRIIFLSNMNGIKRSLLFYRKLKKLLDFRRKSESSLYHPDFATFEGEDVYNQKDAEGFIRLNGLRLKIARLLEQGRKSL